MAPSASSDPVVAVCVCTYKRPAQLARLFDNLLAMERPLQTVFVVVDNDGDDPDVEAKVSAFRSASGNRVEYVFERTPGISAARNAAFARARALGADVIAMLDDDEWPSRQWLTCLLETRERTGAHVIGGPVHPVFPEGSEPPVKYAKLWSVPKGTMHGRPYVYATGNFMIDASVVASLGEKPFHEGFGLTGGEDAVFFRRLFFAGVSMAWAGDALAFEEIPSHRARMTWMRRRWFRQGNVGVMCEHAAPDPKGLPPTVKTILLCARLLVYPLFNRAAFGAPMLWLLEWERVRGRIARHLGFAFQEYARAEDRSAAIQ